MLTKCVNCEFNVKPNAVFCPDCGTENPAQKSLFSEKEDFPKSLIILVTLIFVILAIVIRIIFDDSEFPEITFAKLLPAAAVGLILGFIASIFIAPALNLIFTKKDKRERNSRRNGQTFCGIEDEIYAKKTEFSEDSTYLYGLLEEENSENKNQTEAKLELVECEIRLCELQLEEINLFRIRNQFLPFQQNINQMDLIEIAENLPSVKANLAELEDETETASEIRNVDEQAFDNYEEPDFAEADKRIFNRIAEADEIIDRLHNETLKAGRHIYEALHRRKSALERGVMPTQEMIVPFSENEKLFSNQDNFKIDSILTDFNKYFDEIAIEHEKTDKSFSNR